MGYNGGGVIAMRGKNCVSIASDLRYGIQMSTVTADFPKAFEIGPHLWVGLSGLATDIQTVEEKLRFRVNLYELKEDRKMRPSTFTNMMSTMLYERRFGPFFVSPIVAGLDPDTFEPFLASTDLIGAITEPKDFVVAGNCEDELFGMCEALWREDMNPDQLFESTAQALMNAMDREASSGWGAVVHIIEKDKITTRHLKTRMD